ncbi:hypothetical protein CRM89_10645 [Nocardia sp. FDAARGOS_372]|uniref:hypothetical protein n=1 Tax=Nocardia TaxID=1817 RepID=UPI000BF17943|nr:MULTISPECIES: hypothetical protein [Nocardia]MBF6314102.1 hypothetical protein [Nocardia farcinica]PEH76386.1 hypothetical protein CRM89_10645 [Nocardia sp. FDAARGOS_372]UEX20733.1 hypothetical protein LMJ57_17020 [Nocardia farcinica]
MRVHARGRDTHPDLDVTEPAETYLITLTPTTDPTGTITTLTTGHADGGTASRIPVIDYEQVWVPTQEGGYRAVHRDSPEAHAVYATRGRWGGRPPTGAILDDPAVRNAASAVADIDRNLLDAITALPPQQQFALARRCARWAFERAGLSRIPDFGKALDALDEGREPPAGLANHSLSYHRLATDPTIELTLVPDSGHDPASSRRSRRSPPTNTPAWPNRCEQRWKLCASPPRPTASTTRNFSTASATTSPTSKYQRPTFRR